ncbi:cysteine proteinase [Tricholoma matsutake]|nr:cysteine proteinase [Tricholoma matsutake 945]
MLLSEDIRAWCIDFLSSSAFQQIAPLLVVLLVPSLFILVATKAELNSLVYAIIMGLESFSLPWPWPSSNGATSSVLVKHATSPVEKGSKKHARTSREQVSMNDSEKGNGDGYYPGLVNISGTYCFMNSTLQALASLSYLQPHIDTIHAKAEALDVPSPVIDALQNLFRNLNTPRSSYHALRPHEMIDVLTAQSEGRTNSLLYSREHQDAQELFQLLSECIKNEIAAVDKEGYRDRGLGGLAKAEESNREIGKSVFDGLTANRRSCITCGYTEAVMHFALDNWQLSVPRMTASCPLEWCLEDYTRLEILNDCVCRKCSMLATHRRLQNDIKTLEEATRPEARPSSSKKRRLKEVYKMERQVRSALEEGRIEDDLRNIRIDRVFSKASSKQAMIARPPPVLALHINRSIHYGHYASKNPIQVIFPEVLDLTPYTTSGNLSTVPTLAISTPAPSLAIPRSTTPTPATYAPRTIYRLAAVVCHFGQHSFGHYICYRRKPRSPDLPFDKRWAPPRLVDPLRMDDDTIDGAVPRYVWEDDDPQYGGGRGPGRGWLRISDDSVRECGIETVLQEGSGAFMLYYERALPPAMGIMRGGIENVSEETLKPEVRKVDLNLSTNGSVGSLVSEVGVGVRHVVAIEAERKAVMNGAPPGSASVGAPRIVRSVATGKKRSLSVTTLDREMQQSMRSSSEAMSKSSSLPNDTFVHPQVNGSPNTDEPLSMTASVPSLLPSNPTSTPLSDKESISPFVSSPASPGTSSPSPLSSKPPTTPSYPPSSSTSSPSTPPSALSSHAPQHVPKRKHKQPLHSQPPRTHTPKSKPPQPPAVVGLKA